MKKNLLLSLFLVLILAVTIPGCSSGTEDTLSGATEDILASILSNADSQLAGENKLPNSFIDPVTADKAGNMLGLSPSQFNSDVAEAYVSVAAIITHAHQVALIKCNDAAAAARVKAAVAAGFDSNKWVCAHPDQSFVIDSGSYVLLVAAKNVQAEKLLEAFTSLAGKTGSVNVFYRFE